MTARPALLLLAVALAGCAAEGPRIAPVDEVGVAGTGVPGLPPGEAVAPASVAPERPASSGVVVSTLPGEGGASSAPLAGASAAAAPGSAAAPAAPAPAAPRLPPATGLTPPVVALVRDADRRAGAGEHDAAAATIERALQITPGNAWLWHRLARERLAQGRSREAESLAARSTSLAPGDQRLQAGNWRVIEQARRQRGDEKGAADAAGRAARLEAGTA